MSSRNFFLISLAINLLLIAMLYRSCNKPCAEATVTRHWTDTVYVDESKVTPTITISRPQPRSVKKYTAIVAAPLTHSAGADSLAWGGEASAPNGADCNELVAYLDTLYEPDKYKAEIYELVTGNRIQSRRITFWPLVPQVVEHVEKTMPAKERIQLYLGVFAGIQASYTQKRVSVFNVGPQLVITEPHGLMLGYGFDARNNGHQLQLLYKIKLKR